jgi:hypothetical protein
MVFLLLLLGTRYLMPLCCSCVDPLRPASPRLRSPQVFEPVGPKVSYFE